jgi:hypothetical protein
MLEVYIESELLLLF